jgi:3'-phosphoadenosine 5'-phosphosulfate sulfotransferase (PAPS reductase)/FAD synthetase
MENIKSYVQEKKRFIKELIELLKNSIGKCWHCTQDVIDTSEAV